MAITINGDGTLTGVSVGGLPDGIVDTDMLATDAVTGAKIGSLPAGSVLQVVSTTKTDTWSTSSTTYADVTDLTANITPSSTSSKILAFGQIGASAHGNTSGIYFALAKGGTIIADATGDAASNRPRATSVFFPGDFGSANNPYNTIAFTYLDSPASTSELTYSIQARKGPNSTTLYVNRSIADRDTVDYEPRYISTITLMEVAG